MNTEANTEATMQTVTTPEAKARPQAAGPSPLAMQTMTTAGRAPSRRLPLAQRAGRKARRPSARRAVADRPEKPPNLTTSHDGCRAERKTRVVIADARYRLSMETK